MYRRERSVALREPVGALNNLSVLALPARGLTCYGVVHGAAAQLLSATPDGQPLCRRQLTAKDGGAAVSLGPSLVTQVDWCALPGRLLLVLTSQKGIQIYETDGSIMVYWHALDPGESPPGQSTFARGIAACGHFICVGTGSGRVLVFDVPPRGPNVTLSEELREHRAPVTDVAAEAGPGQGGAEDVVTADDDGQLCVWKAGPEFELLTRIPARGCPCPSVRLWRGVVAAGFGDGQIRVYEAATGALRVQIDAHARALCALDLAPEAGKLLSGAEDSFVHVWQLSRTRDGGIEVRHRHSERVTDTQVCGARFCDPAGSSFAVAGYDLGEI
uniref:WD repeat domain 54 n=1 Tax=Ornithorhynchus anatinus TaxID=9258 RepID=K7EAX2_ORNAN